jgi:hypothetical protein
MDTVRGREHNRIVRLFLRRWKRINLILIETNSWFLKISIFIYGLFRNAVCISYCEALNGRITVNNELEKNVEVTVASFQILSWDLAGDAEENH